MNTPVLDELPNDLPAFLVMPCPLYVPVERAAKIVGVSVDTMRQWVNDRINPVPYMIAGESGKKKLVSVEGAREYAKRKEFTHA